MLHYFVNLKTKPLLRAVLFLLLISSCQKEQKITWIEIPRGFTPITYPSDNFPDENRIALGKALFEDPVLSRDSSVSCQSCHKKEFAFTDGLPLSYGIQQRTGLRNSPTLANIAYAPVLFFDGGVPNLEQQILAPIEDENEMDYNIPDLIRRLNSNKKYVEWFDKVFGEKPNVYTLTRAIAAYERTLLSGNSKYDQFLYQGKNTLSSEEIRGMNLFFSDRTHCSDCHSGFLFTNYKFENIGLYTTYNDLGRARVSSNSNDIGKFKVPSLRNIELTAPYMHDGSIASLDDVLIFFNNGGNNHINKSLLIKPLGLNPQELSDLKAFLQSLTDESFVR